MNILLVSSEVAPFAKSGGLADVAGALPRALRRLGHDVRIVLPCYRTVRQRFPLAETGIGIEAIIDGRLRRAEVRQTSLDDVPVYLVDQSRYFDRDGLYGTPTGDYPDNAERFGFFCRAVLELPRLLHWRPDVLHCNDWQSGLVPVLLRTAHRRDPFFAATGSLLTIHNLGYQGVFSAGVLDTLDLDPRLFTPATLEYWGQISFLKGGVVFADRVNTVSETYCLETLTTEYGFGFEGILRARGAAYSGILNGLDERQWNPATDAALARTYSAADLAGKAVCKRALQQELGLTVDPAIPLVAMVTRLDTQKGLDLVEQAWEGLLARQVQLVLLGTGEEKHMRFFAGVQGHHPEQISIHLEFDDSLSRRIYAGSDLFLMPSRYEPCGLGQLIALRYGSIPVVRRTGGLADTVIDPAEDAAAANGFTFGEPSPLSLLIALDRALALYRQPQAWPAMVARGMQQDFSWDRSAQHYLELYRQAKEARDV
ncbi:MAG TPA: glycogen synthase GlgA [Desulfuromonadales bacterium]